MKFLYLTLKTNDAARGYDFLTGAGDLTAAEITESLEHVLFGNDALFDGEIVLSAEYDGKVYAVNRNFASGEIKVETDERVLSKPVAEALVDELAGLGKKQWKEALAPVDADAFLSDTADYVEKRLAAMGFDAEELERRSLSYATERDRALSQVEILDELVADENLSLSLAEHKREASELQQKLDEIAATKTDADRAEIAARSEQLNEQLRQELSRQNDIDAIEEKLKKNALLTQALPVYARALELRNSAAEAEKELAALTKELDAAEKTIDEEKALAENKKQEFTAYSEKVDALRKEFYSLLDENNTDNAISQAILAKMGDEGSESALASFVEWDKRFCDIARNLAENRLDYGTRRSVREGVAFETALSDIDEHLKTIEETITARKELADSLRVDDNVEDTADVLTLYRAKTLCDVYRSEIAAEEKKIQENEEAQKQYDEDLEALEKAQVAADLYIEKATAKCNELTDRLTGVYARKSFCADVNEMELGMICPVCNSRITDKTEHLQEIEKLNYTEEKLSTELQETRASLEDHVKKSSEINARLAQLREKKRLSAVYVDSLNGSIGRKQDAMKELLDSTGAADFVDLKKKCASGAKAGDVAFFALLNENLDRFAAETEELEKTAAELRATKEAMQEDYDRQIAPDLDGVKAYEYLDTIVGAEQDEDKLFAELLAADDARSQYLDNIVTGGDPARVVHAANEVFREVLDEIRSNEKILDDAIAEYSEMVRGIDQKTDDFNQKLARADDLLLAVTTQKKCADELLDAYKVADLDEQKFAALQDDLLTDEQVKQYESALSEHDFVVKSLRSKIAALPEGSDDKAGEKEEILNAYRALSEIIADEEKKIAVSDAAYRLAAVRTETCDELLNQYELTKKLADGEIVEVILPVLNETLTLAGEKATAVADGLGIKFIKSGNKEKELAPDALDGTALLVALNCALNFVTGLACGKETLRFVAVDKRGDEIAAAQQFGVVEL